MLQILAILSAFTVIFTGIYVLAKGDWRLFGLKFAGICLSTGGAIWLLTANFVFGSVLTCPADMPATGCMTFEIYHVVRNVAFIIFHIATGRDAIYFKKGDRRGALCRKNISKQSLPL